MKFEEYSRKGGRIAVAPLAGAWIEIPPFLLSISKYTVAPLAGAWIEILLFACDCGEVASRSPRGSVD